MIKPRIAKVSIIIIFSAVIFLGSSYLALINALTYLNNISEKSLSIFNDDDCIISYLITDGDSNRYDEIMEIDNILKDNHIGYNGIAYSDIAMTQVGKHSQVPTYLMSPLIYEKAKSHLVNESGAIENPNNYLEVFVGGSKFKHHKIGDVIDIEFNNAGSFPDLKDKYIVAGKINERFYSFLENEGNIIFQQKTNVIIMPYPQYFMDEGSVSVNGFVYTYIDYDGITRYDDIRNNLNEIIEEKGFFTFHTYQEMIIFSELSLYWDIDYNNPLPKLLFYMTFLVILGSILELLEFRSKNKKNILPDIFSIFIIQLFIAIIIACILVTKFVFIRNVLIYYSLFISLRCIILMIYYIIMKRNAIQERKYDIMEGELL